MNWTAEELRTALKKHAPKPSKYRNQKVMIDGRWFASKREGAFYQELMIRQKVGEIQGLECQVPFQLCAVQLTLEMTIKSPGVLVPIAQYIADFVWYEGLKFVVADVKGFRTKEYQLKKRWMAAQYGIDILEVK